MKRLFLLLALLCTYVITSAQEFIISPWGAEESLCYAVSKSAEGFSVNYNEEEGLNFAEGTSIQKIGESDNGYYYIFEQIFRSQSTRTNIQQQQPRGCGKSSQREDSGTRFYAW